MSVEKKPAYEMKPGQGSAFPNDKKVEDWHPDYRGKVVLPSGDTHWLDVSIKESKGGKPYVKVKVGAKLTAGAPVYSMAHDQAKVNGYQPQAKGLADMTDDIPF